MIKYILIFILFLLIFNCADDKGGITRDEYKIIQIVIVDILEEDINYVYLVDSTSISLRKYEIDVIPLTPRDTLYKKSNLYFCIEAGMLKSYTANSYDYYELAGSHFESNRIKHCINLEKLEGKVKHTQISSIDQAFAFYNLPTCPNEVEGFLGVLSLSRAGFNKTRNEAIIFVEQMGGKGYSSRFYLFRKRDRSWRIQDIHRYEHVDM